MAFCLSFPKWCNTYTFVEEIKALEYQTFSTHFLSKFMFFWITQKVKFFTHPNDFLGNNSNNPRGTTGFHAFFEMTFTLTPVDARAWYSSFVEWILSLGREHSIYIFWGHWLYKLYRVSQEKLSISKFYCIS